MTERPALARPGAELEIGGGCHAGRDLGRRWFAVPFPATVDVLGPGCQGAAVFPAFPVAGTHAGVPSSQRLSVRARCSEPSARMMKSSP